MVSRSDIRNSLSVSKTPTRPGPCTTVKSHTRPLRHHQPWRTSSQGACVGSSQTQPISETAKLTDLAPVAPAGFRRPLICFRCWANAGSAIGDFGFERTASCSAPCHGCTQRSGPLLRLIATVKGDNYSIAGGTKQERRQPSASTRTRDCVDPVQADARKLLRLRLGCSDGGLLGARQARCGQKGAGCVSDEAVREKSLVLAALLSAASSPPTHLASAEKGAPFSALPA